MLDIMQIIRKADSSNGKRGTTFKARSKGFSRDPLTTGGRRALVLLPKHSRLLVKNRQNEIRTKRSGVKLSCKKNNNNPLLPMKRPPS